MDGSSSEGDFPDEMAWRGDERVYSVEEEDTIVHHHDDDDDVFRICNDEDTEEEEGGYHLLGAVDDDSEDATLTAIGGDGKSPATSASLHDEDEDEEDFVAKLQKSIERDLPKVKVSKEFQQMLDAVEKEEEEEGHGLVIGDDTEVKEKIDQKNVHDDRDGQRELLGEVPEVTHGVDLGRDASSAQNGDGEMESMIQGLVDSMNQAFPGGEGDGDTKEEDVDERKARVFWQLQPLCSNLLKKSSEGLLATLEQELASVDQSGLQACFDYALFPLSVIIDAVVSSRDDMKKSDDQGNVIQALRRDDTVLGTVKCVRVLVTRCRLHDESQVASLVQKLMMLLSLPEAYVSEHLRVVVAEILHIVFEKDCFADGSDCHTWLQRDSYAPLVGNLIATLLHHPYNDVSKPNKLNTEVQVASLKALASLLHAVDDAQVLAFFVPGISTGLVKRMLQQVSGSGVSKNSSIVVASMEALEQLVCVVFSDEVIIPLQPVCHEDPSTSSGGTSFDDYAARLGSIAEGYGARKDVADPMPAMSELEARVKTNKDILRVDLSWDWVQVTLTKLTDILKMCLPRLCYHDTASVRLHLFLLVSHILDGCKTAFGRKDFLMDIILVLAQDSWPSVKGPAGTWLGGYLSAEKEAELRRGEVDFFEESIHTMVHNLVDCLRENEAKGRKEAIKLASYVEYLPPGAIVHCVAFTSENTDKLLQTFVDCFEMDVPSAVLIAKSPSMTIMDSIEMGKGRNEDPTKTSLGAPDFPNALQYMTTKQTYSAVAGIIRKIGIAALLHDCRAPQESASSFARIIDSCTQSIMKCFDQASHAGNQRHAVHQINSTPWQIEVSRVVIVLSEIIFGGAMLLEGLDVHEHAAVLAMCKRAVLNSLNILLDKRVWLLRTSCVIQNNKAGDEHILNAILQHHCLNFVSVSSRCLKEEFASDGKCMHVAILPVIEKFASDYQFVAASARNAVKSICQFGGYEHGIKELAQKNIDYIVDGMCLRLRQPSLYPDAPKLFAALLKESGVATALIPLLSEPAAHVVRGISIIQRREKPENVLAFVLCTQEIAKGAWEVAKENFEDMYSLILEISAHKDDDVPVHDAQDQEENVSIQDISKYFLEKHKDKESVVEMTGDIHVTLEVWNRLMLARKRLLAAARLEQSIADSVGPLAVSKSLPVAVQSLDAVIKSLSGLSIAHQGLEIFKNNVEECIKCEGQFIPVESATPPSFLPSVHLMWRPLMGSLGDLRAPVIEASIACLRELMILAPKFLARRFNTDAWPIMKSLLAHGPPRNNVIGPGQEDRSSPALVARVRKAVIQFAVSLTSKLTEESAQEVLLPTTNSFLSSLVELMISSAQELTSILKEIQSCFVSLATIDPDAAWVLLYNTGSCPEPSIPATSDLCMGKIQPVLDTLVKPCGQQLLGLEQRSQLPSMDRIADLPVPWHRKIDILE